MGRVERHSHDDKQLRGRRLRILAPFEVGAGGWGGAERLGVCGGGTPTVPHYMKSE